MFSCDNRNFLMSHSRPFPNFNYWISVFSKRSIPKVLVLLLRKQMKHFSYLLFY